MGSGSIAHQSTSRVAGAGSFSHLCRIWKNYFSNFPPRIGLCSGMYGRPLGCRSLQYSKGRPGPSQICHFPVHRFCISPAFGPKKCFVVAYSQPALRCISDIFKRITSLLFSGYFSYFSHRVALVFWLQAILPGPLDKDLGGGWRFCRHYARLPFSAALASKMV